MAEAQVDLEHSPRDTILEAAAYCFMARGFKATSIDDIACRLGATKGMVYHYFGSKSELFFEIHQRAMDALVEAVDPEVQRVAPALDRLHAMAQRHVDTLINTQHYQRAVVEGVQMHLRVTATEVERKRLIQLQDRRRRYEHVFLRVLQEGIHEGDLNATDPRIAIKPVLGALNSVINWYHPRYENQTSNRNDLVNDIVTVALRGLVA